MCLLSDAKRGFYAYIVKGCSPVLIVFMPANDFYARNNVKRAFHARIEMGFYARTVVKRHELLAVLLRARITIFRGRWAIGWAFLRSVRHHMPLSLGRRAG